MGTGPTGRVKAFLDLLQKEGNDYLQLRQQEDRHQHQAITTLTRMPTL
jgi:hypothetical protein